jgi:Tol biopolymer transport system component
VAATVSGTSTDIQVFDLKRGTLQRLTFEGKNEEPVFTPDGKRVIYASRANSNASANLWWKPSDGSGTAEQLLKSDVTQLPNSVSPDGKLLAFTETRAWQSDIFIVPLEGDRKPQVLLNTPFNEFLGKFSPDGKWIAYVSNESGRNEVYVVSYPGVSDKKAISTEGGTNPTWSRDGKLLYYQVGDRLMAVDIVLKPIFRAGNPRLVAEAGRISPRFAGTSYDVGPDGRILIVEMPESTEHSIIRVVENFTTAVQRRIPVAK